MCMEGCGPFQIANQLRADQVLMPTAYKKQRENPPENQAVFPDTHERIIEDDVFEGER